MYKITFFGSWYGVTFYKASAELLELDSSETKARYETKKLLLRKGFAKASTQMDFMRKKVAQQLEHEMIQRFLEKHNSQFLKLQIVIRDVVLESREELASLVPDNLEGDKSMENGGREVDCEMLFEPEEEIASLAPDNHDGATAEGASIVDGGEANGEMLLLEPDNNYEIDGAATVGRAAMVDGSPRANKVIVPRSILSSSRSRSKRNLHLPGRRVHFPFELCSYQEMPAFSQAMPATSRGMSSTSKKIPATSSMTPKKREVQKGPTPVSSNLLSQFQPRTCRMMLNYQVNRNSNVETQSDISLQFWDVGASSDSSKKGEQNRLQRIIAISTCLLKSFDQ